MARCVVVAPTAYVSLAPRQRSLSPVPTKLAFQSLPDTRTAIPRPPRKSSSTGTLCAKPIHATPPRPGPTLESTVGSTFRFEKVKPPRFLDPKDSPLGGGDEFGEFFDTVFRPPLAVVEKPPRPRRAVSFDSVINVVELPRVEPEDTPSCWWCPDDYHSFTRGEIARRRRLEIRETRMLTSYDVATQEQWTFQGGAEDAYEYLETTAASAYEYLFATAAPPLVGWDDEDDWFQPDECDSPRSVLE